MWVFSKRRSKINIIRFLWKPGNALRSSTYCRVVGIHCQVPTVEMGTTSGAGNVVKCILAILECCGQVITFRLKCLLIIVQLLHHCVHIADRYTQQSAQWGYVHNWSECSICLLRNMGNVHHAINRSAPAFIWAHNSRDLRASLHTGLGQRLLTVLEITDPDIFKMF